MHNSETHEFGVFESRYHREHTLLLAEFEVCLKSHKIEERTLTVLAAELYYCIRSFSGAFIGYADRLHRSEAHGVLSA